MKICITGHRPAGMPPQYGYDIHNAAWEKLRKAFRDVLLFLAEKHGPVTIYTGMALGVDQAFAEIVLRLRDAGCGVFCSAAVPCYNQEGKWPVENRELYHKILARCDTVDYVTKERYTPTCMEDRNRWMVDRSDLVIAVWNGRRGGTKNCVDYARANGRKILRICPDTLQIHTDFSLEAA